MFKFSGISFPLLSDLLKYVEKVYLPYYPKKNVEGSFSLFGFNEDNFCMLKKGDRFVGWIEVI